MEQVTEQEQARLTKLLRKHRKRLLALPNVHAVDVGFEFSEGKPSGRLALRVHVTEKIPLAKLRRSQRVPDELDGVPVDVIQFNPEPQLTRSERHDPVIGGVRIRNTSRTAGGTLGMIVLDRHNLTPLALSNEHVMLRRPPVNGDMVSQPVPAPQPTSSGRWRASTGRSTAPRVASVRVRSRSTSTASAPSPGGGRR